MSLDELVAACLIPLALWILVSGVDDLVISLAFFFRRKPVRIPAEADLPVAPPRRIAIFVPLWHEHTVIGQMLEHNISAIRYSNYDIFVGVYPNDAPTQRAVREVARRHSHVHISVGPHNGPTSKADCLNWVYRAMEEFERQGGVRFEVVVTHDAEDLIHPRELSLIGHFSHRYDMVQIPVLPLPTPWHAWIHGLYCDEFAEYQTKDIPVRQMLGGFLPSNGVGCGFTRAALEDIARDRGGNVFEPECLTEDYENGYCVHSAGRPQLFVPLHWDKGTPLATREYFPKKFSTAVRQRTRWVTGIALQGWQRHGWSARPQALYWFWRDRKGLVGNILSPLANLVALYGTVRWAMGSALRLPGWLALVCGVTIGISLWHLWFRMAAGARIYGWRFAAGAPLRTVVGNWLNSVATVRALWNFMAAHLLGEVLAWGKTDHSYPQGATLKAQMPPLGQVLVDLRLLNARDLEVALLCQPAGVRLGEHLMALRMIREQHLYEGLSTQYGIPLADPDLVPASLTAVRALPAATLRRWELLPIGIRDGQLHVGVPDVPPDELSAELRRLCALRVRYWLYPVSRLRRWREKWLAVACWPEATAPADGRD